MRSHRSGKQLLILGLIALGAVAVLGGTRSSSHARQVPAAGPDRKEVRAKLVALRGEIALMEVEHEAEREILKQKLMGLPVVERQIRELFVDVTQIPGFRLEQLDEDMLNHLKELSSTMTGVRPASETLIENLREAKKKSIMADARRAFASFYEKVRIGVAVERDGLFSPLRKDFARHASELASKRLDVEDAERQYRGSR